MGHCPDTIKRLIDRFTQQSDQIRSPDYNETLIRIDYINPLMSELGWDIDNSQGFAERYREVVHEDRVRVAGQTKAPDYSFRIGGQRKFFLEAKKPAVDIKNNWEPAYQLRRYAWSAKLACSLLTDFEEFAIYDARIQPKQLEKASVARREYIRYTDYPERWDFLNGTFSKDAVLKGEFDRYCESKKGRGAQLFDDAFLGEIEEWRKSLASSLARRNESLDEPALNFAVQRIIDRIIFLRIAEDRGTETVGQLQALLNGEAVYPRLVTLFNRADERYNSGLFHFAKEKDRDEAPDTLTPGLDVDDKTLKGIIKALYYPQSPYEFTMVSADILGSVYERFLGKVITLTTGHNARIEEKPEVRKAGGVYYTPTYIVDYIVKNTVGKLLDPVTVDQTLNVGRALPAANGVGGQCPPYAEAERKSAAGALTGGIPARKTAGGGTGGTPDPTTLKRAAKLKILDPACGSGSFLIGAYQFLLDWYHTQYTAFDPAALATGKKPVLRPAFSPSPGTPGEGRGEGSWRLTIAERKRILLDHIHGVDLDGQAVEVTKLNLLLKCLEGETSQTLGFEQRLFRERALPDLGKNILCGNSLIETDIIGTEAWIAMSEEERRKVNPFDYERAFPTVFKQGGFDAVIGNPPYLRIQGLQEHYQTVVQYLDAKFDSAVKRFDTYLLFLERGYGLLAGRGRLSLIIPHKFLHADFGSGLRQFLLSHRAVEEIVSFGHNTVFSQASTYTGIFTLTAAENISVHSREIGSTPATELPIALNDANCLWLETEYSKITDGVWSISHGDEAGLLERASAGNTVEKTFNSVFQGVVTGADDIYFLDFVKRINGQTLLLHSVTTGKMFECEEDAVKPLLKGDDVHRYSEATPSRYCVYPYELIDGKTRIVDEAKFKDVWPKCYDYLQQFRAELRALRVKYKTNPTYWYSCHRQRSMEDFNSYRIITAEICVKPTMTIGVPGIYHNTTVYSFLKSEAEAVADLFPWLGILNSRAAWSFLKGTGNVLRGGYVRMKTNYLTPLPLPVPKPTDRTVWEAISGRVETMLSLHKRQSAEQLPQRREQIQREIDATDRQIDQLVYQLYGLTDDEIAVVEAATGGAA